MLFVHGVMTRPWLRNIGRCRRIKGRNKNRLSQLVKRDGLATAIQMDARTLRTTSGKASHVYQMGLLDNIKPITYIIRVSNNSKRSNILQIGNTSGCVFHCMQLEILLTRLHSPVIIQQDRKY